MCAVSQCTTARQCADVPYTNTVGLDLEGCWNSMYFHPLICSLLQFLFLEGVLFPF